MKEPTVFTTSAFAGLPGTAQLVEAGRRLFDLAHIGGIAELVGLSYEHTCSIAPYARDALPDYLAVFERYRASAFDHGTIQDLKRHDKAHEVYLALDGSFSILWKDEPAQPFKQALEVSADSSCWALIPARHCILVDSEPDSPFLAVAFKSRESTMKNGGKQSGSACPASKDRGAKDKRDAGVKLCLHWEQCEHLSENRKKFFEKVKKLREDTVAKVHSIADSLAKGT